MSPLLFAHGIIYTRIYRSPGGAVLAIRQTWRMKKKTIPDGRDNSPHAEGGRETLNRLRGEHATKEKIQNAIPG